MRVVKDKKKRSGEHRSNSTKVTALTKLKTGEPTKEVSKQLGIPASMLRDWRTRTGELETRPASPAPPACL